MDDSDHICPLCCEEMDISDREFYPCKCGYQICIWCWHKIRKVENGLCPACRTPYGEDPHQFTALDVEEVIRANKEALAAAKREKQAQNQLLLQQQQQHLLQQQQQSLSQSQSQQHHHNHNSNLHTSYAMSAAYTASQHMNDLISTGSGDISSTTTTMDTSTITATSHSTVNPSTAITTSSSSSSAITTAISSSSTIIEPKDRSTLGNLRVIRRNLIYVVGLSPSIANEEMLRKPEYFGQYGKLTKVVLNRSSPISSSSSGGNSNDASDSRRGSSSAYITFQFKEDTLACILALDGFYLDGRTIRASYGTSKYCSAFMKHVRCSNPDCTYLHEMGATEDTFTKQEIQAGYVTSGGDVLARQQQILLEQQQKLGGIGGTSTNTKVQTRKRTGGGGPSGTGKPCANPIFPAPEFEEPIRQVPSIPGPSAMTKASTLGHNPPNITQPNSYINATNVAAKIGRATSAGVLVGTPTSSSVTPTTTTTIGMNSIRKTQSGIAASTVTTATTAASVVASSRRPMTATTGKDSSSDGIAGTPLMALTPLKRSSITKVPSSSSTTSNNKPTTALPVVSEDEGTTNSNKVPGGGGGSSTIRNTNNKKQQQSQALRASNDAAATIKAISTGENKDIETTSSSALSELQKYDDIIIGGDVIGPPTLNGWNNTTSTLNFSNNPSISNNNTIGSSSSCASSLAELGGTPIPIPNGTTTTTKSSILGGDFFNGPPVGGSHPEPTIDSKSSSGSNVGIGSSLLLNGSLLLNDYSTSNSNLGLENGLRRGATPNIWSTNSNNLHTAVGTKSSTGVIGSHISTNSSNSSSALASILGINLPTGTGSLQESLWSTPPIATNQQQYYQTHQQQQQQHQLQPPTIPATGPSPLSMLNESTMVLPDSNRYQQSGVAGSIGGPHHLQPVGPSQSYNTPVPAYQQQHTHSAIGSNRGNGPIRSNSSSTGSGMIGGNGVAPGPIAGASLGYGNVPSQQQQSDISLLQVLLPGVHITSDNSNSIGLRGGSGGWGTVPIGTNNRATAGVIGANSGWGVSNNTNSNDHNNLGLAGLGGPIVGQQNHTHQQKSNQGSGIW